MHQTNTGENAKENYDRLIKALYFPSSKTPVVIDVPPMQYAMIDGLGDPNTSKEFQDAVGALYAISYGIKMLPKKGIVPDGYFEYKVNALEGLWDMPEGEDFDATRKDKLVWTLMNHAAAVRDAGLVRGYPCAGNQEEGGKSCHRPRTL